MKKSTLTPKQERFCQLFVELGNAAAAYREAFNTHTTNESVIYAKASHLRKRGKVGARIAEISKERSDASKPYRKAVEAVLMAIVKSDPIDLYRWSEEKGDWIARHICEMPRSLRIAIRKIKRDRKGAVTVEFIGKVEAAKLLACMNGWMQPTEVRLSGGDTPVQHDLRIGFDEEHDL